MTRSAAPPQPLSWSVSAGLTAQVIQALLGLVAMPIYLRLLGEEAFGVIGFYIMVQAWFVVADVGLSATLSRESARLRGGAMSGRNFLVLLRTFELAFVVVAGIGAGLMWVGRGQLAGQWLNSESLPVAELGHAVGLIGVIAAFRAIGGLYRSVLIGLERIVLASALLAGFAALRFLGVIAWMSVTIADLEHFFVFQVVVAAAELACLGWCAYRALPAGSRLLAPSMAAARNALPFTASIAGVSIIWVVVTQLDKLVVSRSVSLVTYGHFTLGVAAAGIIAMIYGPVGQALMPRLSALVAAGHEAAVERMYRVATRGVSAVVFPVGFTLAGFADEILFAWTGDRRIAESAGPVLQGYGVGNALLAVAAFGYYLQFAYGNLRFHIIGMILFLGLLLAVLLPLVGRFGAEGAGAAWAFTNLVYLVVWMPVVHARFLPRAKGTWLTSDVLPVAAAAAAVTIVLAVLIDDQSSRLVALAWSVLAGVASLLAALLAAFGSRLMPLFSQWRER